MSHHSFDVRADLPIGADSQTLEIEAWYRCPHRGDVLTTITGRVAGCGCSGATVEVYQCRHFGEPVIKHGHPPCLDSLREQVPGATGRTCRVCPVPAATPDPGDVSGWSGLF